MPFKSEKQRKWMWANEPEMAKKWEDEEKKENVEEAIGGAVGLNPNVNVPGMGDVRSPGDPGSLDSFTDQATGSGDIAFPIPDEEDEEEEKKKKKKKKKLLRDIASKKLKYVKEYNTYVNSK
jgi:hypothetical protein